MSELGSIESIESLAKDFYIEDGLFHVTFQAEPGGEEVRSVVPVHLPDQPADLPEEPYFFSLARAGNQLVRDLVGYNAAVDAAATAIDSAIDDAEKKKDGGAPTDEKAEDFTDDKRQEVVFRAFERVMHLFAWDPSDQAWAVIHEARGLGSELQRQLKLAPLQSPEDRELLTRMLLDVATADHDVDRAEEEMLLDFIDRDQITAARPGERGRVSQNDLRHATEGQSRETLYMLACAIAMADQSFDPEESDRLEFYAKGLGLDPHRTEELLDAGQMYFIEQYMIRQFAGRGELDEDAREEVIELAKRLNYDVDSAEFAFERYQRVQDSGGGFSSGLSW